MFLTDCTTSSGLRETRDSIVIYSLGWDGDDDGGTPDTNGDGDGDWVWRTFAP